MLNPQQVYCEIIVRAVLIGCCTAPGVLIGCYASLGGSDWPFASAEL